MLINVPLAFICLPLNTGGRDDALNCASPLELFASSLGSPDNYSERLLATAYWVPIQGHFFDIIHRRRRTSSFKGRDESPPVVSRTAYSVIHIHSLSRGYPRHPSWKKSPGFIYSPRRDFHVNLPRTFVTFPITDWQTAVVVNRGLSYFSLSLSLFCPREEMENELSSVDFK